MQNSPYAYEQPHLTNQIGHTDWYESEDSLIMAYGVENSVTSDRARQEIPARNAQGGRLTLGLSRTGQVKMVSDRGSLGMPYKVMWSERIAEAMQKIPARGTSKWLLWACSERKTLR